MIATVHGILDALRDDKAHIATPMGLTFEVLLPAFVATRLAASEGRPVTLHTLAYLEGTAQGATMFPRLAGFLSREQRAFYELFVTVKGIGHRRALRAMALPPEQIAAAIADRDTKLLQTLPEIGKRGAETIVVTLKDKVEHFVSAAAYPAQEGGVAGKIGDAATAGPSPAAGVAREALEVLLQLGENRLDAVQWIDRVLADDDAPRDAQGVVTEVYRLKAGA